MGGRRTYLNMVNERAKSLVKRSTKAVCGTFEREVTVRPENLKKNLKALREAGFQIVGTGIHKRKIWFIRRGLAGL